LNCLVMSLAGLRAGSPAHRQQQQCGNGYAHQVSWNHAGKFTTKTKAETISYTAIAPA
jgi:hypothetical protein